METHIGAYDIHMNGILPEYWEAMDILYEQLEDSWWSHSLSLVYSPSMTRVVWWGSPFTNTPRPSTVGKWVALTWTEVRGTAINAIWTERNRLLWAASPRPAASTKNIVSHFWRHTRLVAIGKRWPHAEDILRESDRAVFFKHIWSLASSTISSELGGAYPAPVRLTSSGT